MLIQNLRQCSARAAMRLLSVAATTALISTLVTVPTTPMAGAAAPVVRTKAPSGLDRTGRTIPTTSYAVPGGSVFMSPQGNDAARGTVAAPVRTINRAVSLAREGGTIVLRGGEYRDWFHSKDGSTYAIVAKSLTLQAYPKERPWFNGTDVVAHSRWSKDGPGGSWYINWSTPSFCDGKYYSRPLNDQSVKPNTGPCSHFDMSRDPAYPMAMDPQMVFVEGRKLVQRASLSKIDKGSFYYDWAKRRLYVKPQASKDRIEVTKRPVAMVLGGKRSYAIKGIGFRKFASNEYSNLTGSAVYIGGSKSLIENSVFSENAAGAVAYSNPLPGSAVRRSVFARNGYSALGGNGKDGVRSDFTVDGSVFSHNNAERFGTNCTISCGHAAIKFAHMEGLRISRNLVENTEGRGVGIWCDLNCSDVSYVLNVVRNNGHAGIFHEVSDTGIIAGNLITGNTYGVMVASANTKIYHNTLIDNVQGINVYDDQRSPVGHLKAEVGPNTAGVSIANNVIRGRNYSVMLTPTVSYGAAREKSIVSYFDRNTYQQTNGVKPVFLMWKHTNGKVSLHRDQKAFAKQYARERSSAWLTGAKAPLFYDGNHGDFRIRPGTPAYRNAVVLPGDVAAALGVRVSHPHRNQGALL